jgi:hypothetical protein
VAGAVTETCLNAISLLPKLEPILGAGLGVNLAYLNLPPFGYITRVRAIVKDELDSLTDGNKKMCENTPWFKQIKALSEVQDLDQNYLFLKDKLWVSAPGIWGTLYNLLFYWRIARILSVVATIYIMMLLVWGTGQDIGAYGKTGCLYSTEFIHKHWHWSTAAFLWPIFVVAMGTYIGMQAKAFIKYQIGELEKSEKEGAVQAAEAANRALDVNPPK